MKISGWAAAERGQELRPLSYDSKELGAFDCIVKVQSCGICHSDIHMIDNDWGMAEYPLVPGHEVVGEVAETGSAVRHLRAGDRVGIGWQRSACLACPDCLRGAENLCAESQGLIVGSPGGFADHVAVDARFAFPLTSGLDTTTTGPLLCGGATVYSALRHAGMGSGQRIGVVGVGGLGHLAVQFASRLGNQVTVFTTSPDKAELAGRLGAVEAVITRPEGGRGDASNGEDGQVDASGGEGSAGDARTGEGGSGAGGSFTAAPKAPLDLIITTSPAGADLGQLLGHLATDGTIVMVAGPAGSLELPYFPLLMKRARVMGSPIGGRSTITEMLETADRFGIAPMVETFPMSKVNDALARVRDNQVRYRAVLLA